MRYTTTYINNLKAYAKDRVVSDMYKYAKAIRGGILSDRKIKSSLEIELYIAALDNWDQQSNGTVDDDLDYNFIEEEDKDRIIERLHGLTGYSPSLISSTVAVSTANLILETSDDLLLEDGFHLLLE